MSINTKKFNLILSLGGSCFAAHNIQYRNLRYCSMPFDWLFIKDETPIIKLEECFRNDFKDFMKQENLVELQGDEKGYDDNGHYQYKDSYTQYRTIHAFNKPATDDKEYKRVKKIINKRISRMYNFLHKSEAVMLVLDSSCDVNFDTLLKLKNTIKEKFNIKHIEIHHIQFATNEDLINHNDDIYIYKIKRARNNYDIAKTNYEWNFLDDIELDSLTAFRVKIFGFELLKIDKIKKGFSFYFLSGINTLFRVQAYLLGIRIDICVGRVRI